VRENPKYTKNKWKAVEKFYPPTHSECVSVFL